MKRVSIKALALLGLIAFTSSCGDDDETGITFDVPDTYVFERNGATSVSFSGQTTRIQMGEEFISELKEFTTFDETNLLEMFNNETEAGGDADPFSSDDLNASTKSIGSKVAASTDFFSANTSEAATIKTQFETWISAQVNEIGANSDAVASAGNAGQIADGSSTRYVSGEGLEYNQLINKSLIGALMVDQMLNNYLGTAVLDAGDNVANNDAGTLDDTNNYTTMEHKWDEAYGYLYGTSASTSSPNATIGDDDSFLNKYLGRVEGDTDFAGIADEIYEAFKLGRAAIVAGDYTTRDAQAAIIREKISTVIAVRAVYYLQQGKANIAAEDFGAAFHDLSEGYGFIYSLRFCRNTTSDDAYFTRTEVDAMLTDLLDDGDNGLWNVTTTTLDNISTTIADKFDFTVEQAGS